MSAKPVLLTKSDARKIIVHAAGLDRRARFGKGKEAVWKAINHLGFIQVDTIYVVERAHHHALAARVPDYKPQWLVELQSEGRIYEFWTRDAGFMPTEEFRFSIPIHDFYTATYKSIPQSEVNLMNKVLDRIGREGPLRAQDFENDRVVKSSGWWDWRPSKVALERLHMTGKLLTNRGIDFLKVYDLTDNILPRVVERDRPSDDVYMSHVVVRSLRALGIAYANEIAWNGRLARLPIKQHVLKMAASGEIVEVKVEGLKGPLYMLPEYRGKKIGLRGDAFVLSPFDTLNVFRRRLRDFFDFDYQVECFVPAPKRKYGYFSLPILVGDMFVARMDSKAERKKGVLLIQNLHAEKLKWTNALAEKVSDAIRDFAKFNGCKTMIVAKCNNKMLLQALRQYL